MLGEAPICTSDPSGRTRRYRIRRSPERLLRRRELPYMAGTIGGRCLAKRMAAGEEISGLRGLANANRAVPAQDARRSQDGSRMALPRWEIAKATRNGPARFNGSFPGRGWAREQAVRPVLPMPRRPLHHNPCKAVAELLAPATRFPSSQSLLADQRPETRLQCRADGDRRSGPATTNGG